MGAELEQNIKASFSKVKEDIQNLSETLEEIKGVLKKQDTQIESLFGEIKALKENYITPYTQSSIGGKGADKSINQLINQSINHQSINQADPVINTIKDLYSPKGGNQKINQSINQSPINQSTDQSINHMEQLKGLTQDLSAIFLSFSKQELKLFLTIYQLEDENIEPTYKAISAKMQLSEHCVRGHLSSLLKKNAPIIKKRLNNRTTLLSLLADFKALNLKKRLISLYYDSDPHQKTLFDQ